MYDLVVVGARCAGAPAAMLMARKGYRVLLVDRAAFPSDTVSTHILWPHGAEILARWGLLDRLAATGVPPICLPMTFDVGPVALRGTIPDANDGRGGFCPRRTILDHLLVQAAVEAGVEFRERFVVEELLFSGDAVVGLRGRSDAGTVVHERARVVMGADGIRSVVARAVHAEEYDAKPAAACGYYSYFSGVAPRDIELHVRERCAFGGAPTHHGLQLVMVNWPVDRFAAVRADVDGHVWRALGPAPDFAARVRAGRREEKWYGFGGVPSYFRRSHGPGWVLAGDAAYNRDPVTAQGMSDAFIDAELLAAALDAALSGAGIFHELLAAHERARRERVRPMYEFSYELSKLEAPPPHMQQLFAALRGRQDATNAFLSAMTGAIPLADFMSPENLARIAAAAHA